jgi:hypothetical protein
MVKKMNDTEHLKQLYNQANSLNEELPAELIKKLSLYGAILRITGKLHADSLKDWKLAEAKRKETIATVYSLDPNGTSKEREMKGEMAATQFRQEEAVAEAECMRWRNAYTSCQEYIQILKMQIRDIKSVDEGGV